MNHPLIYGNGCSFSAEKFHPSLESKTYVNFVANECQGFAINKARRGSCNRRIIRTTAHDMIHQRQLNPDQQIIALIQLTGTIRSEIWVDEKKDNSATESNFVSIQFANNPDWKQRFLQGLGSQSVDWPVEKYNLSKKYWNKLTEALSYFHNDYAQCIDLYCDLIMLQNLLSSLKVDFLIFAGPPFPKFESEYLLDFFRNQLTQDQRYIDMESFAFCSWCANQGFIPLNSESNPYIGHYGPDAHEEFARQILIPRLKELDIL